VVAMREPFHFEQPRVYLALAHVRSRGPAPPFLSRDGDAELAPSVLLSFGSETRVWPGKQSPDRTTMLPP